MYESPVTALTSPRKLACFSKGIYYSVFSERKSFSLSDGMFIEPITNPF